LDLRPLLNHTLVSLALVSGVFVQSVPAAEWGPWTVSRDSPIMQTPADAATRERITKDRPVASVAATPFLWLISFYQKSIGTVNSGRCPMYPTCSQYSSEAIHKHGPAMGIIMTADRLMHEHDEQDSAPLIKVGGRYRFFDPVKNNDFWWSSE
jgi:uncharacterized protein